MTEVPPNDQTKKELLMYNDVAKIIAEMDLQRSKLESLLNTMKGQQQNEVAEKQLPISTILQKDTASSPESIDQLFQAEKAKFSERMNVCEKSMSLLKNKVAKMIGEDEKEEKYYDAAGEEEDEFPDLLKCDFEDAFTENTSTQVPHRRVISDNSKPRSSIKPNISSEIGRSCSVKESITEEKEMRISSLKNEESDELECHQIKVNRHIIGCNGCSVF